LIWLLLPWITLALWIVVGEFGVNQAVLKRTTEETMRSNDAMIQAYARRYGEVPPSLSELRLYAKLRGRQYATTDSWGGRFEYLRLGRVNYTLRSFGEDGLQNTLTTEADPGIFRWGQMVRKGLQYNYTAGERELRPSVILFAGADNAQRTWHGKLFLDSATGARRLLIRNKTILNLYMLAHHDGVEEFLWLPDGQRVAFTASGSQRYSDGLWVWDLRTDQAWNVFELDKSSQDLNPARQAKALHLALAYVSTAQNGDPVIGVYVVASSQLKQVPEEFFHQRNLHTYELLERENFVHRFPGDAANLKSTFNYEWMGQATVLPEGHGAGLQRAWLKLPRAGNWEDAIGVWQEYAAANAQSPLAAYAIWSLALFYKDAANALEANPREKSVAAGYSRELSLALSRMIAAPGWMQAVGRHQAGTSN